MYAWVPALSPSDHPIIKTQMGKDPSPQQTLASASLYQVSPRSARHTICLRGGVHQGPHSTVCPAWGPQATQCPVGGRPYGSGLSPEKGRGRQAGRSWGHPPGCLLGRGPGAPEPPPAHGWSPTAQLHPKSKPFSAGDCLLPPAGQGAGRVQVHLEPPRDHM